MTHRLSSLRAALTLVFLYYGLRKVISDPADVAIYQAIGFGQFPRYITGSVEVACALGLWWRGYEGIAAAGLVATMCIGTFALVAFAGLPFWHLIVLGGAAAVVAGTFRHQFPRFLP